MTQFLHWKRAPISSAVWHLTYDGAEALCGHRFQTAMRNFSRDLAKGVPDDGHETHGECQQVAAKELGLQ